MTSPINAASLAVRPRRNKKQCDPSAVLMQHILRDPDISIATGMTITASDEWYTAEWLAGFKSLAYQHGRVEPLNTDPTNTTKSSRYMSYGPDNCINVMRRATPERRERCITFLKTHQDRNSYSNLMRVLIATEKGDDRALNNLIALHDYLIEALGDTTGETFTSYAALKLPFDASELHPSELAVQRAVLKITAYCATNVAGKTYLHMSSAETDYRLPVEGRPQSSYRLSEDIITIVRTNPERADRILSAIRASAVRLTPAEITDVLEGALPVSLLDGIL